MRTINNRLYIENQNPLIAREGDNVTIQVENRHIVIDGVDGEQPFQDMSDRMLHYYLDTEEVDEKVDFEINIDKIGDGCLNSIAYSIFLFLILILSIINK